MSANHPLAGRLVLAALLALAASGAPDADGPAPARPAALKTLAAEVEALRLGFVGLSNDGQLKQVIFTRGADTLVVAVGEEVAPGIRLAGAGADALEFVRVSTGERARIAAERFSAPPARAAAPGPQAEPEAGAAEHARAGSRAFFNRRDAAGGDLQEPFRNAFAQPSGEPPQPGAFAAGEAPRGASPASASAVSAVSGVIAPQLPAPPGGGAQGAVTTVVPVTGQAGAFQLPNLPDQQNVSLGSMQIQPPTGGMVILPPAGGADGKGGMDVGPPGPPMQISAPAASDASSMMGASAGRSPGAP